MLNKTSADLLNSHISAYCEISGWQTCTSSILLRRYFNKCFRQVCQNLIKEWCHGSPGEYLGAYREGEELLQGAGPLGALPGPKLREPKGGGDSGAGGLPDDALHVEDDCGPVAEAGRGGEAAGEEGGAEGRDEAPLHQHLQLGGWPERWSGEPPMVMGGLARGGLVTDSDRRHHALADLQKSVTGFLELGPLKQF